MNILWQWVRSFARQCCGQKAQIISVSIYAIYVLSCIAYDIWVVKPGMLGAHADLDTLVEAEDMADYLADLGGLLIVVNILLIFCQRKRSKSAAKVQMVLLGLNLGSIFLLGLAAMEVCSYTSGHDGIECPSEAKQHQYDP